MAQTSALVFEPRDKTTNALEVEMWVVKNEDGSISHFVTNDAKEARVRIAHDAYLCHNPEAAFLMVCIDTYGLREPQE